MKRETLGRRGVLVGALLVAATALPRETQAQVGRRDVSGIRVSVAPSASTMYGHFRGTGPHLYESQQRFNAGPGGGVLALADWRNFGLNLEVTGTVHRFGSEPAYGMYVRGGFRYHPPFNVAGFAPWLDASVFGMGMYTHMAQTQVPAAIGPGFCCTAPDFDSRNLAAEYMSGHSFAFWLERPIGGAFSFWTRVGTDFGRVTDQQLDSTRYMPGGTTRKWIAQRVSVGIQYAFWPLP